MKNIGENKIIEDNSSQTIIKHNNSHNNSNMSHYISFGSDEWFLYKLPIEFTGANGKKLQELVKEKNIEITFATTTSQKSRFHFLSFFYAKGHKVLPSSSLLPFSDDKSLLFVNSGMVQFKDYFLGLSKPPHNSLVTVQLCLRAGGKHNDLDQVGFTARHHTLFEMLGNFSFGKEGGYFKKQAIEYAWEFLTQELPLCFSTLSEFSTKEEQFVLDKKTEFIQKCKDYFIDRLFITVYGGSEDGEVPVDQEAYDCWSKILKSYGIENPEARIVRVKTNDNFWQMGETGPCGPCSEIYFFTGPVEELNKRKLGLANGGKEAKPNEEDDLFLEIWNLVFMQYNRSQDGQLTPLNNTAIDTGMGLERVVSVLEGICNHFQDTNSASSFSYNNFNTSIFASVQLQIEHLLIEKNNNNDNENTNTNSENRDKDHAFLDQTLSEPLYKNIAVNVIADHLRSISALISEGVTPSSTGAGYVLRKIIRRMVYFVHMLEKEKQIFNITDFEEITKMIQKSIYSYSLEITDILNKNFESNKQNIVRSIAEVYEEEKISFLQTLKHASGILEGKIDDLRCKSVEEIAKFVWRMYDTYGLPSEMSILQLAYAGISVDQSLVEKFTQENQEKIEHIKRELQDRMPNADELVKFDDTIALWHNNFHDKQTVMLLEKFDFADYSWIVFDKTPFYPEGGGQVGDVGYISNTNILAIATVEGEILDTQKVGNVVLHKVAKTLSDILNKHSFYDVQVDLRRRRRTTAHHTATHLLQKVLADQMHCGFESVQQGSYVDSEKLRFDFRNSGKYQINSEDIDFIDCEVNKVIEANLPVVPKEEYRDELKEKNSNIRWMKNEKYPAHVRIVYIEGDINEPCGGTHVENTGLIGPFKIITLTNIGKGITRIEAVAGHVCREYLENKIAQEAKKIDELSLYMKTLQENAQKLTLSRINLDITESKIHKVLEIDTIFITTSIIDSRVLSIIGNAIKSRIGNCVLIWLAKNIDGIFHLITMRNKDFSYDQYLSVVSEICNKANIYLDERSLKGQYLDIIITKSVAENVQNQFMSI